MTFICLIVFISMQIVSNINKMCRDGDNIQRVKCSFIDMGRYK